VLQLRAYTPPEVADTVGHRLAALAGVRHLVVGGRTAGGMVELTAEIEASAAEVVLEVLRECDLPADDVTLWKATSVQPLGWRRHRGGLPGRDAAVWADVMGRAREHARPGLLYVLYMASAGVIAGVGVLSGSAVLVVGAMAISPDLLPISATAVGVVERRWALAVRAIVTLAIGLTTTTLAAAGSTGLLRAFGRVDAGLSLSDTALGLSVSTVGPGTVLVALTAGLAGMLAYETAGSAAVGVAISITTIPAASYLGDALALGSDQQHGVGALKVLLTNVVGILTASTVTLWVQRRHRPRISGTP
jgi:uncharacterized hydrophobic protein (TIGR00271 family)